MMRRALAAATATLLLLLSAACGSGENRSDEKAACTSFQRMVDHLRARRSREALTEMRELQRLAVASDNTVISQGGRDFSQAIGKRVADSEVTPEQAVEEGAQALRGGGAALSRIVEECKRLGFGVDLPEYDATRKRIPGT